MKNLFEETTLGGVALRNRAWRSATWLGLFETANAVLAKTAIRYIALSRPLICKPNWINLWQSACIRPSTCVSCNACYRTSAHACLFAANKANATLKSHRLS